MNLKPLTNRVILVVSMIMIVLSLTFSTFSVAKVLSAPLASLVTVPNVVGFEGFLADSNGNAITDGNYSLQFNVYSVATAGSSLWSETQPAVPVTKGLYSVQLGSVAALPANLFNGTRYIGVTVGTGTEIVPRTLVSSVPFALNAQGAQTAESASAAPWSGLTGVPGPISFLASVSPCNAGNVLIKSGSTWACTNIDVPQFVRKPADQSIASQPLVQNDTALFFPINANETWIVEFYLSIQPGGPGGLATAVTVPVGGSMRAMGMSAVTTGSVSYGDVTSSGSTITSSATATSPVIIKVVVVNGTNAGNVQLKWAQAVFNTTATVIRQNSFLRATRIN